MSQIDWVEEDTDLDNSTVEKTSEVVFVEKDSEKNVKEISRKLKLVDVTGDQSDAANGGETAAAAETATAAETAAVAETAAAAETAATAATASETASTDETAKDAKDVEDGPFKSGTLTADGDGYRITLDYTEEAKIPENAELSVREITAETDRETYEACLEQAGQQVAADEKTSVNQKASRFFDIEILMKNTDSEGIEETRKIEPLAPVSVNIQILDSSAAEDAVSGDGQTSQSEPAVLHFAKEGVEQIDSTVKNSQEQNDIENTSRSEESEPATEISFEAESFSIYGVVYTVDFHWEADGKEYDFSIPGGGFVSFYNLVKALGIESDDLNTEKDEIQELVDGVESIEFSNLELLSVSKVDEDTTAGAIKERLQLECEYSRKLTEEQIEAINAQEAKAGDWALISLKPFNTEEILTVTMKNGDQWTVKVTDDQVTLSSLDQLDGREFALVNFASGTPVILSTTPHNTSGRLSAQPVDVNNMSGSVTKWRFEVVSNYGIYATFLISSGGKYLHIEDNGVSTSSEAQESGVQLYDGYIRLTRPFSNRAVNLWGWDYNNGFYVYQYGSIFEEPEQFYLYEILDQLIVTVDDAAHGSVNKNESPISASGYNSEKITATAKEGFWFDHWELDGVNVDSQEGITDTPDGSGSVINANKLYVGKGNDHILRAVFVSDKQFNVTASQGGTVDVSTCKRTKDGFNKTAINAAALEGYWFDHWEVDGKIVSGNVNAAEDGSSCNIPANGINVGNGETLTAVFIEKVKYDVEAVNSEGGSVGECTVHVGNGTPASAVSNNEMNRAGKNVDAITATAGPGFVFKEWQLDGKSILGGATINTSADGSSSTIEAETLIIGTQTGHKVTAVFAQEYTFTVATSPSGAGTVKDDGKTPAETIYGSMTKDGHNKYEIVATPGNGYRFLHWTMNGKILEDATGNARFTNGKIPAEALNLTSSDNICAVFVKDAYTITVNNDGNGWTSPSTVVTESNADIEKKARYQISAGTTNNNYKFAYWKVSTDSASVEDSAVVDWGDGCSATSTTIQPTVNADVTITAVFAPSNYYTFIVTVDNPIHGTVFGIDASGKEVDADGVSAYVGRTRGKANSKNDQRIQVQTTFGGYEFVGWQLIRPNGRVYQDYNSNNKLKKWRIEANDLTFPNDGMTLKAVFKDREYVPFHDEVMDDLIDWADGIANTDYSLDKTAEVFDYDNRIYRIGMSASSKKQAIDSSVVINFITDTSRSMYFPANIAKVGDYSNNAGDKAGKKMADWLKGKSTDQVYYFIGAQNTTATMYALYHDGSEWVYVDASYYGPNSDDKLTMNPNPITGFSASKGDNSYIYQAPPRTSGKPWSRLDYLCMSVEAAADVIYTICPNAQIDLTTFNRSAQYMGTLPTDHAGIEAMLRNIDVSGGTRQDLGLEKALPHFTKGSSKKQVAVLITDGAPNPPDKNVAKTWEDIKEFARQLKEITDADDENLELYTMGLSLKNVGNNEAELNSIATIDPDKIGVFPNKYAKSVTSGQETSDAVKEIVNSLLTNVSLYGTMTDTIDPAFYPVNLSGEPVSEGLYASDGSKLSTVPNDNSPYYEWRETEGIWTITWYNQTFAWADDGTPGWNKYFYIKSKEDFLGGNKISTNSGTENGVTAKGYVKTDTSVTFFNSDVIKSFDYTPYVNVDELHMDENSTEWTVYLGTNADPKTQLVKLFEAIPVKQVVKEGGTTDDIYIRDSAQMYYDHETETDNIDENEPESNYQTLPLSHYLTYGTSTSTGKNLSKVMDDLLTQLRTGNSASIGDIVYSEYGHPAGYFTVTLTKAVNDEALADHAPDAHNTKKPGEGVEAYTVKVKYTPYTTTIPAQNTYEHTTQGGTSGIITTGSGNDTVESNNSHKINVYSKPLDIMKVDEQGMPIPAPKQAKFELFRAWTSDDTDSGRKVIFGQTEGYEGYKLNGSPLIGEYFRVDTQTTDDYGIAHFGLSNDTSKLLSSGKGDYILIEKEEPDGYEKDINAKTISIETSGNDLNFYSSLALEPLSTATMPFNWNQGVRFILKENDGETSSQTVVEYVDENGRKLKLYKPGLEETDENLRDYVFSEIENEKQMITDPVGAFRMRFLNVIGAIEVVFKKVGVNNTDQTGTQSNLGGAKFTLYEATGTNKDTKGNIVVVDDVAFQNKSSDETTGIFWTGMLPVGDYLLEETEAPAGYNMIGVLIKVSVSKDGVSLGYVGTVGIPPYNEPTQEGDTWTITAVNTAGFELPSTGGSGTNLIYLLGIMFTGIAGAGLLMRKRRRAA